MAALKKLETRGKQLKFSINKKLKLFPLAWKFKNFAEDLI
jgi:hypothetical protein